MLVGKEQAYSHAGAGQRFAGQTIGFMIDPAAFDKALDLEIDRIKGEMFPEFQAKHPAPVAADRRADKAPDTGGAADPVLVGVGQVVVAEYRLAPDQGADPLVEELLVIAAQFEARGEGAAVGAVWVVLKVAGQHPGEIGHAAAGIAVVEGEAGLEEIDPVVIE